MQPPSFFDEYIKVAEDVGGGIFIFDPNDRLVFINDVMRSQYEFIEFREDTCFENIFWSSLSANMYSDQGLYRDPRSHLEISRKIRKSSLELQFIRNCSDGRSFLCTHKALPHGWDCQIRVDISKQARQAKLSGEPIFGASGGTALPNGLAGLREMERLRRQVAQFRQMIDHAPFGMAIVSAEGRVLDINQPLMDLLTKREGLCLTHGRLTASDPRETAELLALVKRKASAAPSSGKEVVFISRKSGSDPHIVAVAHGGHDPGTGGESCAVVLVSPSDVGAGVPLEMLAALYQLTPAEARVVTEIGRGKTPDELADESGRSVGTVRNQIKAAMAKIGLDRQVQLVRLLMRIGSIVGRR